MEHVVEGHDRNQFEVRRPNTAGANTLLHDLPVDSRGVRGRAMNLVSFATSVSEDDGIADSFG